MGNGQTLHTSRTSITIKGWTWCLYAFSQLVRRRAQFQWDHKRSLVLCSCRVGLLIKRLIFNLSLASPLPAHPFWTCSSPPRTSHNLTITYLSVRTLLISLFLFSSRSTDASLPSSGSIWSKLTKKGGPGRGEDKALQQAQMALARQRLVTLVFDDMETVRMVRPSLTPLPSNRALTLYT